MDELLKGRIVNGWNFFGLVAAIISVTMLLAMVRVDLSRVEAVSSMIQFSVRCAVPWLYLAFAASSLQTLFPGLLSRWLLRNRKIIGLCFAAAMAWQLLFILWLVGIHTQYYIDDVYVLSDVVEGVVGYTLLIAMVLTSFKFGRSRLSPKQWKILHTSGIYWLWAYAWSVYWFNLFYYQNPVLIDYIYYWGGFLAWGLRIAAWSKKHWQQTTTGHTGRLLLLGSGVVAVIIGLTGSSFGSAWSPQVYELFAGIGVMQAIDIFMPYFPFVPFYPIFTISLGAFLIVKSKG
ncbi:MAG TPA: hypothetical protein EYQ14_09105 [Gammaproteobacteria bacterium]|nr:hypothetical protein [Gammaproteobacteria bacterium]